MRLSFALFATLSSAKSRGEERERRKEERGNTFFVHNAPVADGDEDDDHERGDVVLVDVVVAVTLSETPRVMTVADVAPGRR